MPSSSVSLAAIRQPAFLYDAGGRIAEANDRAESLAGRSLAGSTPAAVVGIFDVRSLDGTPLMPAGLPASRALRGEEAIDVPLVVTAADGRTLHVLATAAPLRNGDEVIGAFSIWQDISVRERMRAEAETAAEELRVQQEELRQLGEELVRVVSDLDRQQRLLDGILGALPHHVSLWDRNERLIWANECFAAVLGEPREALVGRTWRELWGDVPEIAPLVEGALQSVAAGTPFARELEAADPAGPGWRAVTFLPIFGDQVLVIAEEITERKRADETLRRRLEELEALTETVPVAIWIAQDPECREITGNRTANEFYEAREGENVSAGPPPGEPVPPRRFFSGSRELAAEELPMQHAAAHGVDVRNAELEVLLPGGRRLTMLGSASPLREASGAVRGCLGAFLDITERKRVEEEVRESEARFRSVLDSSLDALYRLDLVAGRYEYVSPAFERVVGRSAEEMLSLTAEEARALTHPDDAPALEAALARLDETGTAEVDYRIRDRDGRYRWVSNHLALIRDESGRPLYRDGVVRDVTEQREAEEALRVSEARQTFLLELNDALGPLADPKAVQEAAARVLGEHLGADRVAYFEVDDGDYVVEHDYTAAVPHIAGRYPIDSFGLRLLAVYRSGTTAIVDDVEADPDLSPDEKAGFAAIQVRAYIGVPLVKADAFVAGLAVHMASPRAWTPAEVALVEETAERTWAAVERARVEQALRESEERFRTVIENSRDGINLLDLKTGRYVLMSPSQVEMAGYSLDEINAISAEEAYDLVHPDDRPISVEQQRLIASGEEPSSTVEYRWRMKSGEYRWFSDSRRLVRDADGTPVAMVGVSRDITDQKRAEEALRESEAKYRRLFASLDAGFCVIEVLFDEAGTPVDYVFLEANPAFVQQTGLADAIGRRIRDLNPAQEEHWFRIYGEIAKTGEPQRFVESAVLIDGWYEVYAFPIGELGANQVAVLFTDITERKRAEEVLRETRDYLDSLIDHANAPIVVWDPAFRITRFNAAFEHLSGYAADEVMGRDLAVLFPEESRKESLAKIQRTITEQWESVEIPILRPDGGVRIALWNSANIYDNEGTTLLATIAQGQDITERKEAEAALREYAESLRRSNEDLERFAYVASHDLQEPLRSIVSFSQLLERRYRGKLGPDADEYIEFIVEGGSRMQGLILDLLAFSRVNTTRQQIARTDAEDVLAEAERALDASLREADATLTHDPLPVVMADPTQLAQVFANLISNAVKFRKPDVPLRVHVGVRRLDGVWEFSVADNGIGIEPEYFDRIFVIFQRLHTKDTYPGTGIGLAIVKRIIDRHGGTIRVESTPGEGTTFVFTLPAA